MKRLAFIFLLSTSACAAPATVIRVIDGDTIVAQTITGPIHVRLAHIDAPESRMLDAKCAKELRLGLISKWWLASRLPVGKDVALLPVPKHDKYGRLLAVVMEGNENINETMLSRGLAVPYEGGKKRGTWCD